MKKFLIISKNKNFYNRQEYIIDIIKQYFQVDLIYLDDIFENYSFFYKYWNSINYYWADSYSFYYSIFKKIILENINPNNYSWLIVTYDWDIWIQNCIKIFKELNIPTYNILHEGFFINIDDWYNIKFNLIWNLIKKSRKNLNIPVTDYTFVWWNIHKNEFIKRWYKWIIKSIWTFKFEKYNNINIDSIIIKDKLWIKNIIVYSYIYQSLDHEKNLKQIQIINDLYDFVMKKDNIKLIVRNQIWCNYIKNSNLPNLKNIIIDWLEEYKINAMETIFVSDKIFWVNSTMLLEWIYVWKNCYSFKYFDFKSPFLNDKILSYINHKNDIEKVITNNKIIDKEELEKMKLNWDIETLLKYLNLWKDVNKFENVKYRKKFYLKYIYLIINPFLIKNLIQSLFYIIKKILFLKK